MNLDFLKNLDKKIIILAIALLVLIALMITSSVLKKTRRKNINQDVPLYTTTSFSSKPILKDIQFSNIVVKKYSDTNFQITATITNLALTPSDAFTISLTTAKESATALIPSLTGNASTSFSTNVSIDLSSAQKVKAERKSLSLIFQ